ncbi:SDR family oxidoreductase [Marinobacterium stanieri]|uniref:SDR family oxidoreductase n=1 Tax=Marinobacterium stanieri TaxID=49186 RepID=UPI003A8F8384
MIAITGATGQLGQQIIESLLQKTDANNLVALVRNPAKAEALKALGVDVREADYDRPETLVPALKGVEKLLLISANEVGHRVPQHQAVIEAAKAGGVGLLAYTSILKADTSPMLMANEHKVTEALIQDSGIPAVILRNGWYSENYTQSIGAILQVGAVNGAAQDGRFHTATRKDYAEAAAVVLTTENQAGKVYELAGDTGFTLAEFADALTKKTGQTIGYNNMKGEEFTALLVQIGLPQLFAEALADSEVQAAEGWLADDSKTLSTLIGRPTTAFSESIAAVL